MRSWTKRCWICTYVRILCTIMFLSTFFKVHTFFFFFFAFFLCVCIVRTYVTIRVRIKKNGVILSIVERYPKQLWNLLIYIFSSLTPINDTRVSDTLDFIHIAPLLDTRLLRKVVLTWSKSKSNESRASTCTYCYYYYHYYYYYVSRYTCTIYIAIISILFQFLFLFSSYVQPFNSYERST